MSKLLLKRFIGIICASFMIMGTAAFTACSGGNQEVKEPDNQQTEDENNNNNNNNNNGSDDGEEDEDPDDDNTDDGQLNYTESDVYGNEYIKYHNEGDKVQYVFEAECTNLQNKSGPTFSGNASGSKMAIGGDGASNGGVVSYLYAEGNSVNFIIVSDRDVNDAELVLTCGAEFNDVNLDANSIMVRVDPVPTPELFLTPYRDGGAWGDWDSSFLDYFKFDLDGDPEEWNFNGQYINPFECGAIEIKAAGVMTVTGIADFVLTLRLPLKAGVNSISIITDNNVIPSYTETQRASAVAIDCIKITTTAQLGLYDPQDNSFGTDKACTYTKVED